jgi:DNA-binding response OmpR family regulator
MGRVAQMRARSVMSNREFGERHAPAQPAAALPDRLIVVDDDPGVAEFVTVVADRCGYDVRAVRSLTALKDVYPEFPATVIALDLTMPDADGIEVMTWLASARCAARLLLISGTTPDLLDASGRLGRAFGLDIAGTMVKPFGLTALTEQLRKLALAHP